MLYANCKIYGPYKSRKDKRSRIIIQWPNKKLTCISYPKYLMELHLGKYLNCNETVDHIDGNVENNDLSNFQILNRLEHLKIDNPKMTWSYNCPNCNKEFIVNANKQKNIRMKQRKLNYTGPFCSRSCAVIYQFKNK